MSDLLVRIAKMREQLFECERVLRAAGGNKLHARQLADLRDSANALEAEVYRAAREVKKEANHETT
jgi:hypothetical protein